jgi:PAS domain S-box-containing protein
MNHKLEDIVDVKLIQELQEKLNVIYSFPSAIIDNDGKVLTAVAWQDICTKFHRVNTESEKECIKSDQYILEHLNEANPAVSYKCPHGLVDNATPIIINGKHYGNFFTGQFFLETKPDIEFFRQQAIKFGFDEVSYLEAVQKVPIWSEEKLHQYLDFIKGFIEIIAGIGLKNLKEIESNKQLELAYEKLQQENEERKQAETAYNESSQFNKQVINNAQVGIIVYDLNLKYQVWNPFMENISGIPASEVLGKHPMEVFPFLKDVGMIEILERALKGEIIESIDFPFHVASTGKKGWTSDKTAPLCNSEGEIIGAIATVRDITERKRAEDALRESERKNKAWIENSPVCTKIVDLDFNLQFMSESGIRELRIDNINEFYGKPYPFYFYPDSFKIPMRDNLRKAKETGEIITQEASVNDIEGNKLWYHSTIVPVKNDHGILDYLLVVSLETTNRKKAELALIEAIEKVEKSEERFKLAMKASNDGLFDWNLITNETYYSPRWKSMLGYKDNELPNDFSIWENYTDPDDVKKTWEIIRRLISKQIDRFSIEFKMKHKDGHWVDILARAEAIFNENGKAVRIIGTHTDITERKQIENLLIENDKKVNSLVEKFNISQNQAKIGSWEWDLQTNNIWWSEETYKIFGVTPSDYKPDFETNGKFLHPDDQKEYASTFAKCLESGEELNFDVRLITPSGEIKYCNARGKASYNSNDQPVIFSGVIADITERKLVEKKLYESEAKYRLQFQNMSSYNSIYEVVTDIEGNPCDFRFVMVNQAYETYVGKRAADLIGKTLLEVYPETEQYWIDKMVEAVITEKPLYIENYSKVMNTYTDIELYVPQKGQLAMISSNINDRKIAEEAVRKSEAIKNAMVSNISDVIVIIDSNGINKYKSPNVTKLFGWNPEELVGKNTWDNIHPDDLEAGQKFLGTILSEPNATGTTELRYKRKDGNYVWIEINVINLLDDNYINGILGNYKDITERKQAEMDLEMHKNHLEELVKVRTEELEKANYSLQQIVDKEKELNEMKSRFLSTTSHEFRTPLTSILSSSELIQRFGSKWSDEKRSEHLNRIIISVEYLTRLLDDILTLNRADSGKISFNPEKLNLHQFANDCLLDAELLMTDMHELKFNYKSKQNEFQLDPKLMKFIFNNLLSNAAKYSPKGGLVELNISTDKKRILIEVSDQGIGIPSDETDKIFESFYRTKHTNNIAGTGLGLAIVKRAVDLHGGEIKVESELGKGTTFTVKIPIAAGIR